MRIIKVTSPIDDRLVRIFCWVLYLKRDMAGTMRQLEERQLPAEVTTMLWSPKMDLLAISNVKG